MLAPLLFALQEPRISFDLDLPNHVFRISNTDTGWSVQGEIEGEVKASKMTRDGHSVRVRLDVIREGVPVEESIECDGRSPLVKFRITYGSKAAKPLAFPVFKELPKGLHAFSYRDSTFAPPTFSLFQTSTPWLLFDGRANAMIFSPASNFMVAKMVGDPEHGISASLNDRLASVPKGLEADSILVFGHGIGATWDRWGTALRARYGRKTTDDLLVRKFGYWTDNGADYYYNYDLTQGYAGTLLDLVKRYRSEGISLGYLQLDSWWYRKSIDDPAGQPEGASKNKNLPAGDWNRYGGTMIYRAHPDLFPNGLAAFRSQVDLPLVTHGRWIDRKSPYHESFKFSGVGPVDPLWWADTMSYLKASGVICYEQDWLDRIYANSPEMPTVAGVADAFTDGMANAARAKGMTLQYCMASPRFFLQGVKYSNLATIRVSDDRFVRARWEPFLFTSQLATEIGALPWVDVFKSGETANMILAVLSAGPVGTGDEIGKEDKANILRSARPDGVIVKPDRPIVPCDQCYLDPTGPIVASTYTDNGLRTSYVFAFPRKKELASCRVQASQFGLQGEGYLIDLKTGGGKKIRTDQTLDLPLDDYAYYEIVPVGPLSGIALVGDTGKFVPTGRQRITSIHDSNHGLDVAVEFALNEGPITLEGYAPTKPRIAANAGSAVLWSYDSASGRFTILVSPLRGRARFRIAR